MSDPSSGSSGHGHSPEFGYQPPTSFQAQSDTLTGRAGKKRGATSLGILLITAGIVLAVLLALLAVRSFPDTGSYPRASGERQPVELTAGEWTVFAEGGGALRPRRISSPAGEEITVGPLLSNQTYSIGGRNGQSVGSVTIPADGTYLVTTEPGHTVAFGQNFGRSVAASIGFILGAVFGGGLLVVVGVVVVVVAQVRRNRVA